MELWGKKIAFLGDSITEGTGVSDCENNRYDNRIGAALGLSAVYNHGIGGTRLAHKSVPSEKPRYDLTFCGRVYNLERDADVIVVFGGTNDYGHGDAPLGTRTDETPATYMGAVRFLMNYLTTEFAGKTVVFMTPAHRLGDGDVCRSHPKNGTGRPLVEYVDAILDIAKDYHIPVLDLYRDLGIDPNREEDLKKYAPDGLHFNDAGHARIAALLEALLCSL